MSDLLLNPVVEVVNETHQSTVEVEVPAGNIVEISAVGLQGPPGPAGPTVDAVEAHDFTVTGNLTVRNGRSRIYFDTASQIVSVRASVSQPSAGAPIKFDVNRNGTSIYNPASTRPFIAAGAYVATISAPAVTNFDAGDYMTIDIDGTGTTVPGANLTVTVRTRRI